MICDKVSKKLITVYQIRQFKFKKLIIADCNHKKTAQLDGFLSDDCQLFDGFNADIVVFDVPDVITASFNHADLLGDLFVFWVSFRQITQAF